MFITYIFCSGCNCRLCSACNFSRTFPCNPGQSLAISTILFVFNLCYYHRRLPCKFFVHPQLKGTKSCLYRSRWSMYASWSLSCFSIHCNRRWQSDDTYRPAYLSLSPTSQLSQIYVLESVNTHLAELAEAKPPQWSISRVRPTNRYPESPFAKHVQSQLGLVLWSKHHLLMTWLNDPESNHGNGIISLCRVWRK